MYAAIADWCEEQAKNYPAEVFTPEGKTSDGIAGTALREFLTAAARRLREQSLGPVVRHAVDMSQTGWFAEFVDADPVAPWQPSLQSDDCFYSLDVRFDSKAACEAFIRRDVIGCRELA